MLSVNIPPDVAVPTRSVFTVNASNTGRCSLIASVRAFSRAFITWLTAFEKRASLVTFETLMAVSVANEIRMPMTTISSISVNPLRRPRAKQPRHCGAKGLD